MTRKTTRTPAQEVIDSTEESTPELIERLDRELYAVVRHPVMKGVRHRVLRNDLDDWVQQGWKPAS